MKLAQLESRLWWVMTLAFGTVVVGLFAGRLFRPLGWILIGLSLLSLGLIFGPAAGGYVQVPGTLITVVFCYNLGLAGSLTILAVTSTWKLPRR